MRAPAGDDGLIEVAEAEATIAESGSACEGAAPTQVAAVDGLQVGIGQVSFARRVRGKLSALLLAKVSAICFIFPGTNNVKFHKSVPFIVKSERIYRLKTRHLPRSQHIREVGPARRACRSHL